MIQSTKMTMAVLSGALMLLSTACSNGPLYGESRNSSSAATQGKVTCNDFHISGSNAIVLQGKIKVFSSSVMTHMPLRFDVVDSTFFNGVPATNGVAAHIARMRFFKINGKTGTPNETPLHISLYLKGTNRLFKQPADGALPNNLSVEALHDFEIQEHLAPGYLNGVQGLAKMDIFLEDVNSEADIINVKLDSEMANAPTGYFLKPVFEANPSLYLSEMVNYSLASSMLDIHPFKGQTEPDTDYAALATSLCF